MSRDDAFWAEQIRQAEVTRLAKLRDNEINKVLELWDADSADKDKRIKELEGDLQVLKLQLEAKRCTDGETTEQAEIASRISSARVGVLEKLGDTPMKELDAFHHHEVLHTTSIIRDMVYRELCEHVAVIDDPKRFKLAEEAVEKLNELYQLVGEQTL